MDVVLVVVFVFLFTAIIYRSVRLQRQMQQCIKEGNYSQALALARRVGDWRMIIECIREIENSFSTITTEEAVNGLETMLKMGYCNRVKNLLLFKTQARADRDILMKWFWWRV